MTGSLSGGDGASSHSDRGLSDVLGFVFAFALVAASVGVIYTTGLAGLEDAQRAEQTDNVERAFDVLEDNVADVYADGAPSRATEIKLSGGTVSYLDSMQIRVQTNGTNCAGTPCPSLNNSTTMNPTPLAYVAGDTSIVYVAGAVFRTEETGSVMLSEPDWVVDSERALFPGVVTYEDGDRDTITGETTALVVADGQQRSVSERIRSGPGHQLRVNVTVTTVRADAWKRYFEDQGYTITRYDPDASVVSAEFTTERAYVGSAPIALRLSL